MVVFLLCLVSELRRCLVYFSQQIHLAVSFVMISIVDCFDMCFLVLALRLKITYATRLCPESYWVKQQARVKILKIMSILVSGRLPIHKQSHAKLIAKRRSPLKISVFLFYANYVGFYGFGFLFHLRCGV